MAKQKKIRAPATNGQANQILLRLSRLIDRQMARETSSQTLLRPHVIASPERASVGATNKPRCPASHCTTDSLFRDRKPPDKASCPAR